MLSSSRSSAKDVSSSMARSIRYWGPTTSTSTLRTTSSTSSGPGTWSRIAGGPGNDVLLSGRAPHGRVGAETFEGDPVIADAEEVAVDVGHLEVEGPPLQAS